MRDICSAPLISDLHAFHWRNAFASWLLPRWRGHFNKFAFRLTNWCQFWLNASNFREKATAPMFSVNKFIAVINPLMELLMALGGKSFSRPSRKCRLCCWFTSLTRLHPQKKNLFPRDYKANICLQSALLDGKSALDYRFECWFICHKVQSSSMFEFQSISTLIHTKSAKSLSSVGGRKATMFAFLVMDLWTGRFAFFYWFASFSLSFFTPRENRKKLFMNFFLATVEFVRLAGRR